MTPSEPSGARARRLLPATIAGLTSLALLSAACSGDDDGSGPSAAATTVANADASTPTAPGAGETTDSQPPSTPPEVTSNPGPDTTIPVPVETVPVPAQELARNQVRAAAEALPEGWEAQSTDTLTAGTATAGADLPFASCLEELGVDYDLERFDEESVAVWELSGSGPPDERGFVETVSLTSRVFDFFDHGDEAFAMLTEVLGTEPGRACLQRVLPAKLLGLDAATPVEAEVTERPGDAPGVGARLKVVIGQGDLVVTLYADVVAENLGGGSTVVAAFLGGSNPVDPATIDAVMNAARTATAA